MTKRAKVIIAGIIAALLLTVLSGGAVYLFAAARNASEITSLKKQISDLKAEIGSGTARKVAPEKPQTEGTNQTEYNGWQTFTDEVIGYSLKYPPGWTNEINSGELDGKPFRYVVFLSPENEYYASFGLRAKGSDMVLTERTGLGAGDFENAGTLTVLGEKVTRANHVYKGKVKTIFYPSASGYFAVGNFEGFGEFSKTAPETYESFSLRDIPESAFVDKIIKSLEIHTP